MHKTLLKLNFYGVLKVSKKTFFKNAHFLPLKKQQNFLTLHTLKEYSPLYSGVAKAEGGDKETRGS